MSVVPASPLVTPMGLSAQFGKVALSTDAKNAFMSAG